MEILPGVYWFNLGASNCCLIAENGMLALVDAGVKRSYPKIIHHIESIGFSPSQLTHILLTHADIDHVGAARQLQAISGAKIYASQIAADALVHGRSSRQIKAGVFTPVLSWFEGLSDAMQLTADEILAEGDTLPFLGGLQVIATPGHTPGHISFYAPQVKLLFAGDSVSTQTDKVLYNRMKIFNWDQEKMKASVHRQHKLHPEIVTSRHGPVVFEAAGKFPAEKSG